MRGARLRLDLSGAWRPEAGVCVGGRGDSAAPQQRAQGFWAVFSGARGFSSAVAQHVGAPGVDTARADGSTGGTDVPVGHRVLTVSDRLVAGETHLQTGQRLVRS